MTMKMKLNTEKITIDLSNPNKNRVISKLKSLDINSRFKHIYFTYNGNSVNLADLTCVAYILKPDGNVVFTNCTIVRSEYAELEFKTQSLITPGIIRVELFLIGFNSEISSFILEFEVIKNIRDDRMIESTNEFTALQNALIHVGEISSKFGVVVAENLPDVSARKQNTIYCKITDKVNTNINTTIRVSPNMGIKI